MKAYYNENETWQPIKFCTTHQKTTKLLFGILHTQKMKNRNKNYTIRWRY